MKIIISGGGIAGLTLALTAKKAGYTPILVQKRSSLNSPSFGGGIGLWPPSQMVMQRLGILEQLQKNGMYMPSACYYNSSGHILAHPSSNFSKKFPVLCLQREQLSKSLLSKCLQQGIQILTNTSIQAQDIESEISGIRLKLSNDKYLKGNILIGADGIGSKVRDYIMNQQKLPKIIPYHCQYAYFRAVVNVASNHHSQWHNYAFESWGERKRFGYVPLKYPFVFWFVAIPIGQSGLQKIIGSHSCTKEQKEWIKKLFQYWQSPIQIKQLIQLTPADTILRTDICKVKDVASFPWSSNHKNVIILGDAANATAPNLAQGAGLAIESAWDLISMVELSRQDKRGLDQYLLKRKKRATTVQTMADLVAEVGQLSLFKSSIRNFVMKNSTYYLKELQKSIFQTAVSHSVGGDQQKLYWMTRNIPLESFQKNIKEQSCLIGKIMGSQSFNKLPEKTRKFRSSLIANGKGIVNVQVNSIATLFGLPKSMKNQPFEADCETYFLKNGTFYQKWARVFGVGKQSALKYQTYHYSTPNLKIADHGLVLTQSLGKGPDIFRFGYMPRIQDNTIYYQSKGLWFRNYKIPIPQFILPTSSWSQKQTSNGWEFDGSIQIPKILGSFNIMKYSGIFNPQAMSRVAKSNHKRVIIAGGTGLIGSHVAKTFYLQGWNVQILSRNSYKQNKLPFAKFHEWNLQQFYNQREVQRLSQIISNANVIINLSGENPGAGFWNQKTKTKILTSRLNSIKLITQAIKKSNNHPKFIQASAAGIYGNRNQEVINDNFQPGKQQTFRVQTCKQIQKLTFEKSSNLIQSSILRIGHVISSQGGLFPHLELASKFRAKKFGKGGQYAPWIHISDLAHSIVHIASNFDDFKGKTINVASPDHCTYDEILSSLAKCRRRNACIIPVPEIILKKILGQLASVLLDSQRMHPKLLLQNGFTFQYSKIDKALTSMECL